MVGRKAVKSQRRRRREAMRAARGPALALRRRFGD
jgi:hypothetical protein